MRIVCISDTHIPVADWESWALFPRQLARFPRQQAEGLYGEMRQEINLAYDSAIAWLKAHQFDLLVHLGDVSAGWWAGKELGCVHPVVREVTQRCVQDLQGLAQRVRWVLGNHDLGGCTPEGVEAAERIFDAPLWWACEDQGFLCLGICAPLACYSGTDPGILGRQCEQREFIGNTLFARRLPWLLFSHSPWAVRGMAKEIAPALGRLCGLVTGDCHRPGLGVLSVRLKRPLFWGESGRVVRRCLGRYTPCPSTAPLWWQGYGLLELEALGGGVVSMREVRVERPAQRTKLPTESALRCLWWMRPGWVP
jgi:hypothetical protein